MKLLQKLQMDAPSNLTPSPGPSTLPTHQQNLFLFLLSLLLKPEVISSQTNSLIVVTNCCISKQD